MQPFIGTRHLSLAACFVLLGLLVYRFLKYLTYAFSSIVYPFELDYGEGIIWQQALLIPGDRMYGDINRYPFIVFHYPPLYHLAVKTIASFGVDYLVAGRALSVLSTVVLGVLIFRLTAWAMTGTEEKYIPLLAGIVAALAMYTYRAVIYWSPLMRVDMLAISLSFLGINLAVRSIARPALLYGAMLSFVAALYTRQTSLAAPIAVSAVLLLAQPKQTLKAILVGVGAALTPLLYLNWTTRGGFFTHILHYNINRFSWSRAVDFIGGQIMQYPIYVLVAVITLYASWRWIWLQDTKLSNSTAIRQKLVTDTKFFLLVVLTVYFILTSTMLILVGKSGSDANYFIEWMCVASVIMGIAVGYSLQLAYRAEGPHSTHLGRFIGVGLPMALMCQILLIPTLQGRSLTPVATQQMGELLEKIRAAPKPVFSEDMVLLMKAGKEVPLEPAIFAELANVGQWNEQRFVELVRTRYFEFVVVTRGLSMRHTSSVSDAIKAAYRKEMKFGDYIVYLPSD